MSTGNYSLGYLPQRDDPEFFNLYIEVSPNLTLSPKSDVSQNFSDSKVANYTLTSKVGTTERAFVAKAEVLIEL